jgi:hypothetical protein
VSGNQSLGDEVDLSAYGLVNAVTHFSQDVEDYDRATEFEALGGKLIELALGDWKELAHAAWEPPKHCHRQCFGTPALIEVLPLARVPRGAFSSVSSADACLVPGRIQVH